MNDDYVVYKSFGNPTTAKELAKLLQQNGIPFQTEDTSSPLDPVIVGTTSDPDFRIKLRPHDFAKADSLLDDYYGAQAEAVQEDHYLFAFTDAELYDILEKPDEWGTLDYKLAQRILNERGLSLSPEHIQRLKSERFKEMARPEQLATSWIVVGYLLAVVFGFIGIFFGYIVATSKKAVPDGRREYLYTKQVRNHGWNIFTLGCIFTAFFVYFKLLRQGH